MSDNMTSKQKFATALRKSGCKTTSPRLVASIGLGIVGIAARSTSIAKGYDVGCRAGVRPLIVRRQVTNLATMVLSAIQFGAASYQLASRRGDNAMSQYGSSIAENNDLFARVLNLGIIGTMEIRELTTGTTLIKKHPISGYGRTVTTAALLVCVADGVTAAHELHNRREQWLPKLEKLWSDIVFLSADIKRKMTGKPDPDEEEIARLVDAVFEKFFAQEVR